MPPKQISSIDDAIRNFIETITFELQTFKLALESTFELDSITPDQSLVSHDLPLQLPHLEKDSISEPETFFSPLLPTPPPTLPNNSFPSSNLIVASSIFIPKSTNYHIIPFFGSNQDGFFHDLDWFHWTHRRQQLRNWASFMRVLESRFPPSPCVNHLAPNFKFKQTSTIIQYQREIDLYILFTKQNKSGHHCPTAQFLLFQGDDDLSPPDLGESNPLFVRPLAFLALLPSVQFFMQGNAGIYALMFERYKVEHLMCSLIGNGTHNVQKTPGGLIFPPTSSSISTANSSSVQILGCFNEKSNISGRVPLGSFTAMFTFTSSWRVNTAATKFLAMVGYLIPICTVKLVKLNLVLHEEVRRFVPYSCEPASLASFIENYGAHVTSATMGVRDVVYVKKHQSSPLAITDNENHVNDTGDQRFLDSKGQSTVAPLKYKDKDVIVIFQRKGGDDLEQSHAQRANAVNISSGASILAAFFGAKVGKQGNRSSFSAFGLTDVVEALGVVIELDPEGVMRYVNKAGIGFMTTPKNLPTMNIVSPVRKKLKIKTVFNILGSQPIPLPSQSFYAGDPSSFQVSLYAYFGQPYLSTMKLSDDLLTRTRFSSYLWLYYESTFTIFIGNQTVKSSQLSCGHLCLLVITNIIPLAQLVSIFSTCTKEQPTKQPPVFPNFQTSLTNFQTVSNTPDQPPLNSHYHHIQVIPCIRSVEVKHCRYTKENSSCKDHHQLAAHMHYSVKHQLFHDHYSWMWNNLLVGEAVWTWEQGLLPHFNLEDKVVVEGESNVTDPSSAQIAPQVSKDPSPKCLRKVPGWSKDFIRG